jgi:hypothetical protein
MVMKKASSDDSPLRQGARESFWTLPISGRWRRRLAVCFVEKCSSLQLIQSACTIDRVGQAVLDHILCTKQRLTPLLGCANIPELVAVAWWYLWWERQQFTNGETLQDPSRAARAIDALYSNFYAANSPRAKPKREGWTKPLRDI